MFTLPVSLDLFNLSTVSFGSISANISHAIYILVDASLYVFGRWWGGGKVIAPPRQSVVRLFFVVVCAKDFFSYIYVGSKISKLGISFCA